MSISLSGGDIAFIAAFIVLPTIILASCVWAIVAIRAGVLLPQRPRHAALEDAADRPYAEQPIAVEASSSWAPPAAAGEIDEPTTALPDMPLAQQTSELDVIPAEPVAPTMTEAMVVERDALQLQDTGELASVEEEGARPVVAEEHEVSAAANNASEPMAEDEPEVETWDTEPEPEPEPEPDDEVADASDNGPAVEPEPEPMPPVEQPAPVIRRKAMRKSVAQLRPPVGATGRSRPRSATIRRPGQSQADTLATEDERAMQGNHRAVNFGSSDNE